MHSAVLIAGLCGKPPHPLHKAESIERLHHATWAGDIVLIVTTVEHLTQMTAELMPGLAKASLTVKWGKARYWSLCRLCVIGVAAYRLQTEADLKFLGLCITAGGDPKFNARMTAACHAFHSNKAHLTVRRLPKGIRWNRRKTAAGPIVTYGCWGWLWPRPADGETRVKHTLFASRSLEYLEEGRCLLLSGCHQPLCEAVESVVETPLEHISPSLYCLAQPVP